MKIYTIYAKTKGINIMFPYSTANTNSEALRKAQELYKNEHIQEIEITITTTESIFSKKKEG